MYYCVQCGASYEASFKFCNRCGCVVIPHPQEQIETGQLPEPDTITASVPEAHGTEFPPSFPPASHDAPTVVPVRETSVAVTDEPDPSPTLPEVMGAPLIEAASFVGKRAALLRLVLLELGIIFALSVVAFAVADDLSRAALSVWIPLMAAICALPFLLYYADKTRKIFKHLAIMDEAVSQAGKRLLRQGIVFALLFLITASIVGYAVGNSGRETQQMITDINLQVSLANRIGDQRKSAEKIVPAQIAMYDKLETDVRAYSSVCKKLQGEWTVYDGKYPASHKTTETSLHDVNIEVKRADLLLKQIQVARQLRSINDADQQWVGWKNDMQPLLDEENALD
jgi:hypothetical protein